MMLASRKRVAFDTNDYEQVTVPYAMPQSYPYNAPQYSIIPTPDGTGSAVHPDVIDFGVGRTWHGYRYWMGVTPYFNQNDDVENPCILGSNDAFNWEVPTGLTNPIDPMPANGYNSDPDITYDPVNDQLFLIWRSTEDFLESGQRWETLYIATSADGVNWSDPETIIDLQNQPSQTQLLSPALVRMGEEDWRLFVTGAVYSATSPFGPWGNRQTFNMSGLTGTLWHSDVIRNGNYFWMLAHTQSPWALSPAVSNDGVTWVAGQTLMIEKSGSWDNQFVYRGSIVPHINGTVMRMWYSANGVSSYRVGYTHVPQSLWKSLEA